MSDESTYDFPPHSSLYSRGRSRAPQRPRASPEKLREFNYSDVTLTGGPLKRQYDWVHAHFLSLDNDRLLKVYRQRAGLPAPGDDMGGWYDADGFVPGHTIGQYISGLSRIYAHARCRHAAKVNALVAVTRQRSGPTAIPTPARRPR